MKHLNDRAPNFYNKEGKFYLVKCFACSVVGVENNATAVATGSCSNCGWSESTGDIMSIFDDIFKGNNS